MTAIYKARWILPIASPPIEAGAIVVENDRIAGIGPVEPLRNTFPAAEIREFGNAVILPGLINAHSHLELTAMRGFLEAEEGNFFAWLIKLTLAKMEKMTPDDFYVSAAWGLCEAARAGVTCFGDASDSGEPSMKALIDLGLRGTVFQESFGPDPTLTAENVEKLKTKVARLRERETPLVRVGVSPHTPYTVCAPQLEAIAEFASNESLPLMIHAAESGNEELFMREGRGAFADGLALRGIEWRAPGISSIDYLKRHHVLDTQPLLAHCINVDSSDISTILEAGAKIAHCPKSNAKLGHGVAPFAEFLRKGIKVGLGSDSVASNNTCDMLEETRVAILMARGRSVGDAEMLRATDGLRAATSGGAEALGLENTVGELREGLQADFAIVSLDGAHQTPSYNPADTLVFSSSGRDVVLTVVAGKEIYREGRIVTADEERLRAQMKEIAAKLSA